MFPAILYSTAVHELHAEFVLCMVGAACHNALTTGLAGYRGISAENSPVMLSVLDEEKVRILSDMTDPSTTSHIEKAVRNVHGTVHDAPDRR